VISWAPKYEIISLPTFLQTATGRIVSTCDKLEDECVTAVDMPFSFHFTHSTGLHGDWVVGYYVNMYFVSSQVKDPAFAGVPQVRIEGTLGSITAEDKGNCVYANVDLCTEKAHVCHRQTAKSMANRTKEIAAKAPGAFRYYP